MPEPTSALLETLASTIEDLKRRITAGEFRSEAEISQGVVIRILRTLGWPDHQTQVVNPQFKIGSRRVDYALCHPPGQPSVLLEVKDLGKADEKGEEQLFKYCFEYGVPIAVLTDGQKWSFFFPAGLGRYEHRRFAEIDLVKGAPRASARTLTEFLRAHDVRSGEARKRAERAYDAARLEREAAAKFEPVWQKLLSRPESVLLDLFLKEVEKAAGVRPDRNRGAEFIRAKAQPISGLPSRAKKSRQAKKREPSNSTVPSFTFRGETETFKSGVEVMGAVFGKLASMDPKFCERFAEQHYGRVRSYVAKTKDALYPGQPEREQSSHPLPGGWWLATHCSNSAKIGRIKKACEIAGLEFGQELAVHIPIGSRKKNESLDS